MVPSAARTTGGCEDCQHRTLRLFCNLTPEALAAFSAIGTTASFARGATLFREGEAAAGVYVLCAGQVKLSCSSAAGKSLILKIANAGDVLGLSATVAGVSYEVTAESVEPIQVRYVARAAFLAFLEKYGEAGLHATQAMQAEYKSAFLDARMLALSGSASARLAYALLEWAKSASCGQSEQSFHMVLTHEELGSMVNLSRETVTRLLGRFQKEKLLAVRGARMTILEPERMQLLAES